MVAIITGISIGFTGFLVGLITAWLAVALRRPAPAPAVVAVSPPEATADTDADRTALAAEELRDLAEHMASDVGRHQELVSSISSELEASPDGAAGAQGLVKSAAERMLKANETLTTRLQEAERRIEVQAAQIRSHKGEARIDVLTGIGNRRAFKDSLSQCFEEFKARRRPFAIVLFDLDRFQQINDAYSHEGGEEALRAIGRILRSTPATASCAYRFGGEEFALLFAGVGVNEARVAAEELRRVIEKLNVEYPGGRLRVTASFGVAEIAADERSLDLVRRADDCISSAKQAGRNVVFWHDGEACQPWPPVAPAAASPQGEAKRREKAAIQGLAGPQDFAAQLGRRIAEVQRSGAPLSLLAFKVCDLDKLPEGADAQAVFDAVTRSIALSLRGMDLLGRLADDRFIALLPGTGESAARIVGQRVKAEAVSQAVVAGKLATPLQMHLGVTAVSGADAPNEAIGRAQWEMEQETQAASSTTSA